MRHLDRAADVIAQGGIVAYATEYCFGLGCDPRRHAAVERLLKLKQRARSKGLIVLAAEAWQLEPYVDAIPAVASATWPGPHTWLVAPNPLAPKWITGRHARIAVRVTAHAQAAALCHAAGMAIVSTSANRSGQVPARSYREVLRRFAHSIDYVVPGVVGDLPGPTPIRDALSNQLVRA